MNELENNQPDDQWRKVFDEATETPPPRVWDAIERRLDESEGPRVLPLWGTGLGASRMLRRPAIRWGSGIAAAVALLLVGWWALRPFSTPNTGSTVAETPAGQTNPMQRKITPPDAPSADVTGVTVAPAVAQNSGNSSTETTPKSAIDAPTVARNERRFTYPARPAESIRKPDNAPVEPTIALQPVGSEQSLVSDPVGRMNTDESLATVEPVSSASAESLMQWDRRLPDITVDHVYDVPTIPLRIASQSALTPADVTLSNPGLLNRVALAAATLDAAAAPPANIAAALSTQRTSADDLALMEPEVVQSQRKGREVWASVSMMPGAFDPAVGIRTAATPTMSSVSLTNTAVNPQSTINSRANFSVAYHAVAGMQLNERWSVESGVGYLAGRSTVDSPTQQFAYLVQADYYQNAFIANNSAKLGSNTAGNLYVDALRNQAAIKRSTNALANADAAFNNRASVSGLYSAQARQAVSNDYEYVQVPVQVGYQLRPRKRLGLAILGGFLTNIFVRNTVADELVITSRDGVYRPLSWAASMGARFRYRPSRRWSASLAGLYQPSLSSGTRPESLIRSRSTAVGMSFGVDYHF